MTPEEVAALLSLALQIMEELPEAISILEADIAMFRNGAITAELLHLKMKTLQEVLAAAQRIGARQFAAGLQAAQNLQGPGPYTQPGS